MVLAGDWRQRAGSALKDISNGTRGGAPGSSNSDGPPPSRGEYHTTFARFAKVSHERLVPLLLCSLVALLSCILLLALSNPLSRSAIITPTTTAYFHSVQESSSRQCPANISEVIRVTSLGTDSDFPRPVPWSPRPGKFLLATCVQGQLTNRQLCVHKSLLLAMLLNRTLILPPLDVCPGKFPTRRLYDLSQIIDFGHLSRCFPNESRLQGKTQEAASTESPADGSSPAEIPKADDGTLIPGVVTLESYLAMRNISALKVDLLACGLVPDPAACANLRKCQNDLEVTPITFPSNISRVRLPLGRLLDLASRLETYAPDTVAAPVLSLGDPFQMTITDFCQNTAFLPPEFLPTSCKLPIRPPAAVIDAAAWFMQEYIGRDFAAVHLRRKDFLSRFLSRPGNKADYFPLSVIAECVAERIHAANAAAAAEGEGDGGGIKGPASFARPTQERREIRGVFLCTDASERQVKILSRYLWVKGIPMVRVNLPLDPAFQAFGGDRKVAESPDAAAMVEKVIAANARLVLYARGSSFSGQIRYLRRSMGLESCWDGIVCEERVDGSVSLPDALVE